MLPAGLVEIFKRMLWMQLMLFPMCINISKNRNLS